ncbi:dynein regulatory complex protein 1 isoform X2 [Heterodontus francisci]|uniref:dynein regulatory complex protein 1 isoform X2 n=1 Tax=Heterodontus francisci TaxID=7792 RepID=UPI00355B046F
MSLLIPIPAKGEEQDTPSVNSDIPEERIAARRLRIAQRLEEKKREAKDGGYGVEEEDKEDLSKSCKQVLDSHQRLLKLKRDGTSLVTNVQIAEDSREMQRRNTEGEARKHRTAKLENEATMSEEKFEAITKKWLTAKALKIPQDLRDILIKQQQLCAELIEGKNKLINTLQKELKLSDDQYVKDLKKAAEDIDLLLERMEEQIKTLSRSYREELIQIEKAFQLERHELMKNNLLMWEKKMQMRRDKEIEYLVVRMQKVEEYEDQLQQLRVQDAEEYNMIKIKLETDVEILEQQLEQMKATYQLNQEKLEYNFQVLKKRDEENTVTKSQQKRKITRQHDILNKLMEKLAKQEKMYREENQALTDQYKRTVELYKDLQKKMRRFAAIDAKKFEGVWLMNEKEAKDLVRKVLDADRIIHEQQLGLSWTAPDLCFMKNVGPIVSCAKKKKSAAQLAEEVILGDRRERDLEEGTGTRQSQSQWNALFQNICYSSSEEKALELCGGKPGKISLSAVKTLLEVLCDESGFLIESKLLKILAPLEKDERSLIKLDAIFAALGIENEDDIIKLTEFFIKHCKTSKFESDKATEVLLQKLDREVLEEVKDHAEEQDDGMEPTELEEVCINEADEQEAAACADVLTKQHLELVHPNDILKTLRLFLEENQQPREKSQPKLTTMKERDSSEDSAYWDAMTKVIPENKLKTWNCLEGALENYYHVQPTKSELSDAIDSLASGKAPGKDGITPEIIKSAKPAILSALHELFCLCWDEGAVPQDMRDANIITLYKNGDRGVCNNYRGISLLSIVGKVFARVALNRLQKLAERVYPEAQCGFRAERSTIDMLFFLRQIQEKCREQQMPLYIAFIDLTKAFDLVSRRGLFRLLEKIGCPPKLLSIITSFHDNMKGTIQRSGTSSDPFPILSGVKQGCVLAPTLFGIFFSLLLSHAFKSSEEGIFLHTRSGGRLFNLARLRAKTKVLKVLIRELLFADDAALTSHTEECL